MKLQHRSNPVYVYDDLRGKKPVTMMAIINREKVKEKIDYVVDQINTQWKAFIEIVLTSPFLNEFALATSGALIFVASMAWRDFLQNMLDSVLSIVRIKSKVFTTFLNAIIFTCLAAFIVILIHPGDDDKKKKK